jgi:hypothetical protein
MSVDVRTFDSFALELSPRQADDARALPDFDRRVEAASIAISNDPATQEFIRDFEHVLIDEAPDLVGPRSGMMRALLRICTADFTMFR